MAGLRLLSLERPACQAGPSQASGNSDFRRVPIIPDKNGSFCLNLQSGYVENTFSFWESELLNMLGRRCLQKSPQQKPQALSFPGRHFTCVVITECWGIKHILYDSIERGLLKAYIRSSLVFIPCAFSFAHFALYSFILINHSYEYNKMLNPVSHSSTSLKLQVFLEIPSTTTLDNFWPEIIPLKKMQILIK